MSMAIFNSKLWNYQRQTATNIYKPVEQQIIDHPDLFENANHWHDLSDLSIEKTMLITLQL